MRRRFSSIFIRVLITGILFAYLYESLDWQHFGQIISRSKIKWLLAAVAAYGVTTAFSIWRWHILLSAYHTMMRLARTAQLTMIGLFANSFLPGTMSGDVFKIYYATKELPHIKPTVVMSVIIERLLGFIAMFLISTVLILLRYKALTSETATRYAVYFYFAFFGIIIFVVILAAWEKIHKFIPFLDKLPFQEHLREAADAYRFFMTHPTCIGGGLLISAVAQFSLMFMSYCVALALGMDISFWDLAAVLPLVMLVTLIPATPGGLGVREVAFKHFLLFAGMTKEASVALSLGSFLVVLFWNLLGGLVYLQFRSHDSNAPSLDASNMSQ